MKCAIVPSKKQKKKFNIEDDMTDEEKTKFDKINKYKLI